ncbi:uncharacterized protein LOC18433588 [Amborella trichopoda]|uniref:Structure-specific endonuclease subunit SLX1 homolog n=1 Tax=Amborella trichopoda TaxID=13333 RepID=W1PCH4_AMBTC|nr:uncharacterized protein LOC18433588 [Amborella trichopoda]ERN05409.1 hypothetical protein AMTR_s00007p00225130 [Amborella trichopoda]|eukprot:XP_006843734.1 uncharacterized protein LOC18433588 [Amborella trichopoda]
MRKKNKGRVSETPISGPPETLIQEKHGFFACYLLCSLSPRHKGHTYIGFTINPRRRIRQHNGEIGCGAWRTKRKRPWEMVLCIYGFPSNVSALQFEWAWQHPTESLAVIGAAASLKTLSGVAGKVKLAYTMLTLPAWHSLNLTVNFFSTKYLSYSAGHPTLPEQMNVLVRSMDELPCYLEGWVLDDDNDDDEGSHGHGHVHIHYDASDLDNNKHSINDLLVGNKRKKNHKGTLKDVHPRCEDGVHYDGIQDHCDGQFGINDTPIQGGDVIKTLRGTLSDDDAHCDDGVQNGSHEDDDAHCDDGVQNGSHEDDDDNFYDSHHNDPFRINKTPIWGGNVIRNFRGALKDNDHGVHGGGTYGMGNSPEAALKKASGRNKGGELKHLMDLSPFRRTSQLEMGETIDLVDLSPLGNMPLRNACGRNEECELKQLDFLSPLSHKTSPLEMGATINLTPLSCTISSCTKQSSRIAGSLHPEIIDLTDSPLIIQL